MSQSIITFRERLERGLCQPIKELEEMLGTRSTLAILTHYQMRLYAAFDKSKLPDGFWAKWRYLWALMLEMPYRKDDSPETEFTDIDALVEKIFEAYLVGALFERGTMPGSEKEFLARLGLALSTREPDLLGFPEQIKSWAADRLQPFNNSYFEPQFGMTYEEIFRWLDSLIKVLEARLEEWGKEVDGIVADMRSIGTQEPTIEAMRARGGRTQNCRTLTYQWCLWGKTKHFCSGRISFGISHRLNSKDC